MTIDFIRHDPLTAEVIIPSRIIPPDPARMKEPVSVTDLAARLPAAVLADLLNITPGTAVRWMHQAGGDWNRYAAEIARTHNHQP